MNNLTFAVSSVPEENHGMSPTANVTITVLEVSLRYRRRYLALATQTVIIQNMDIHEI